MSQSFDIKRFGKLLRHDVRSMPMEYSMMGAWMAIGFPPLMVLFQYLTGSEYNHGASYRLAMMTAMVVFWAMMLPTSVYANVGKKKRGIYFAMLPATKAEKHLVMAALMVVIIPAVLMAVGLALDTLLSVLHVPGWDTFFWQAEVWQFLDVQMLVGIAVVYVGSMFGMMFANTVESKGFRTMLQGLMFLWFMGAFMSVMLVDLLEVQDIYWYIIAVEAVLTLFLARLSRHRMDRMTY
ncbi:MAG: hypothetical protein IJ524_08955 [Bacteroidales bacterium]|nr:hypothetical protein [Bacteroidales bacterium]